MVDAVRGPLPGLGTEIAGRGVAGGSTTAPDVPFGEALARRTGGALTFSGHAAKRIGQRGVELGDEQMRRLETAVDRAQAKGSRDSLILLDDLALVVSVTNRTVVTAVNEASQRERVFTNIDSVVIAE